MVETVEFRIDITADPRKAIKQQKQVARALDKTEKEALQLRNAMIQALSQRDRGTGTELKNIAQILERTEEQALITSAKIGQMGRDIRDGNLRRFNKGLDNTAKKANKVQKLLKRAFAGIGIALAVRQFVRLSDTFTEVQNRLRTVIPDQEQLNQTYEDLRSIASGTRTELAAIAQLYQRGAISAKELGASNEQLLLFVDRVGKSLAVEGTSAAKASGALLQLSQALGSGIVRGEEFNSILEGAQTIAQGAAKGIDRAGGSVSKLRTLIIKGEVTSREFFDGFLKGSAGIDEQFEKTESTIGQAFTKLNNEFTDFIGKFNRSTGVATGFANGIILVAENLNKAVVVAGAFATVLLIKVAGKAIPATIAGLQGMTAAQLASNRVFLAAGLAVGVLLNRLDNYNDHLKTIRETNRNLKKDLEFFFEGGKEIVEITKRVEELKRILAVQAEGGVSASESQIARLQEFQAAIDAIKGVIREETEEFMRLADAQKASEEAAKASQENLERRKKIVEDIRKPAIEFNQLQEDLNALLQQGLITQQEFAAVIERARPKEAAEAKDPFAQQVKSLTEMNEELRIQADNFGVLEQFKLVQIDLQRQGKDLSAGEKIELLALLSVQARITAELDEQKKAEQAIAKAKKDADRQADREQKRVDALIRQVDVTGQLKAEEQALLDLRRTNPELIQQIDVALENLRLRQLEGAKDLQSGFARAFAKIKEEAEDLAAVGENIVNSLANNTEQGINQAISNFTTNRAEISALENDVNSLAASIAAQEQAIAQSGKEATAEQIRALEEQRAQLRGLEGDLDKAEFSFENFANAVLEDIQRIIIRLLVMRTINAVAGAFGGGGATQNVVDTGVRGFGAGARHGKTVQPGQAPLPVGEGGTELFVPDRTGTIVPNPADVQQAPPQVNLQAVVVESMDMVPQAIESGVATEAIIIELGKNKDRVKQVLA